MILRSLQTARNVARALREDALARSFGSVGTVTPEACARALGNGTPAVGPGGDGIPADRLPAAFQPLLFILN